MSARCIIRAWAGRLCRLLLLAGPLCGEVFITWNIGTRLA